MAGPSGDGDSRWTTRCPVCGLTLDGGRCANWWCGRPDRGFSMVWCVADHDRHLRWAISRYKFRCCTELAPVLAAVLVRFLHDRATWFEEYDLLVGVPGYSGPGARRPWDPLGVLLSQVRSQTRGLWPVASGALVKTAETPPMSSLSLVARRRCAAESLRPSLEVRDPAPVRGARILLVDDVFTEGSTLREVALALLGAGAAEVAGLCLARQRWKGRS